MQQNSVWLSISLFCNREHWHTLLYKGIKPFVKENAGLLLSNAYQLEFNDEDGENIRLKLLTDRGNPGLLAQKADRYFKQFFTNVRLPFKAVELPPDELFMPFPPNSIQYGLYNIRSSNVLRNCRLETGLSDLITAALEDQVIDEETLITLGFYLHMGLFKVLKKHKLDFVYKNIVQQYTGYTSADSSQMHKEYKDSAAMLLEIYQDTIQRENDQELLWLGRWMRLCEEEISLQTGLSDSLLTSLVQNRFIFLIHTHLGISKYLNFLLWYFIKQVVAGNDSEVRVNS